VALSGGALTQPVRVTTNHFGYFVFDEVEVGNSYIISVDSKRYTFKNPTRVFNLEGDLRGIDFVGDEGFR
jgi:hypothetical protein